MLETELPGILRWAVQGCLEWQKDGLGEPEEVRAATAAYREEMDVIGAFIDECCVVNSNCKAKSGELYKAYGTWCDEAKEFRHSQRRFGEVLTGRGFERFTSNGTWYRGIGIRQEGNIRF